MLKEILKTNMIQIVADLCCRLIAIQKIKPFKHLPPVHTSWMLRINFYCVEVHSKYEKSLSMAEFSFVIFPLWC